MNRSEHPAGPILVPGSRRGRPGRPKQGDHGIFQRPEDGQNTGMTVPERYASRGDVEPAAVRRTVAPCAPRLFDLHDTAAYLGLSHFTVRELEQQGILPRIRIPLPHDGELRKLLFDKQDLDALIDTWKERTTRG